MERQGRRAPWDGIPEPVRDAIDEIAGAPVVRAVNVSGGFSPGPAARCELADGRRVFVKACGSNLNPVSPTIHRREIAIMAALPDAVPVPKLLGSYDDGDWVALVLELIEGRMPIAPLPAADVDAILRTVEVLADAGTPAPAHGIPAAGDHETSSGRPYRWRLVADEFGDADSNLDDWSRHHLDELIELESPWIAAVAGNTLLHGDLRADNILFAPHATYVVDWPSAAIGAPWLDLVGLLPAMHLDGAPPPGELFGNHPVGRRADPDAVNAYLGAILGYFTHESLLPPPPGLPTLRAFQRTQAEISRVWLSERLGWR
jgi:Phosphotransferase enzyme family